MEDKNRLIYLESILLNLRGYTVNVFGAGGTGSHLIDKLGAIAYALRETTKKEIRLTAYDFDRVSVRNVGRSDFSLGDSGYEKTVIAVSKANLAYGLEWHTRDITEPMLPAHFNFICTDNMQSRLDYMKRILEMAHPMQTNVDPDQQPYYIFDIGNDKDFGQIVLLDTQKRLLKDINRTGLTSDTVGTETCGERPLFAEQGLFVNQFMATIAAEMFWQLITQYNLDYSQVFCNLSMMKVTSRLEWK